jgi:folate-binding protein YgfZ
VTRDLLHTAFAARIERDTIHVAGPDAIEYLQGQLSQDVAAVAMGDSTWTLLLDPSGKVDAWLRVTRVGTEECVLDVDAGWGDTVVARLRRFLLRTKADIGDAQRMPCLAVRGVALPEPRAGLPIVWPTVVGYDQLGDSSVSPDGVVEVDRDGYELARIRSGVPANGRELTSATIPAEAGQWLITASVDFTKGCYTGQELVARINSRGGNVPRPIRGVVVEGIDAIADGIDVVADSVVGAITSSAPDRGAGVTVALAPVARAVVPGTAVTVDGRAAEVRNLPLQ